MKSDISPEKWFYWKRPGFEQEPYDYYTAVISKMLSILGLTELKDIEDGLDEPDPKILPLRTEKK